MISTKERVYPYNHKSISFMSYNEAIHSSIYALCNNILLLRLNPPDDFLEWKNLHMEMVLAFNPAVATSVPDLQLLTVGVIQQIPFPIGAYVPGKRIEVNRSVPNTGTKLKLDIDLTSFIDPTGPNWVELVFPEFYFGKNAWGNMEMWKLDALYTTEGIR